MRNTGWRIFERGIQPLPENQSNQQCSVMVSRRAGQEFLTRYWFSSATVSTPSYRQLRTAPAGRPFWLYALSTPLLPDRDTAEARLTRLIRLLHRQPPLESGSPP